MRVWKKNIKINQSIDRGELSSKCAVFEAVLPTPNSKPYSVVEAVVEAAILEAALRTRGSRTPYSKQPYSKHRSHAHAHPISSDPGHSADDTFLRSRRIIC